MDQRKRFLLLLTVGLLLMAPVIYTVVKPGDPPPGPHTAEYFPVQDPGTGKWGFIDNQGKPITAMVFDWAGDFRMGLGLAESGGAIGYINASFAETGEWAISPRFELLHPGDLPAHSFFDGLALARGDDGRWGYIDMSGKWAIEPRFDEAPRDYPGVPAGDFSDGRAWFQVVEMDERYKLDENEDIVRDENNKPVMEAYPRRRMGFIDRRGKVVIEPKYEVVSDYGEGLAAVWIKSHGQWGFIDRDGKQAIGPAFEGVGRFSEGRCAVRKNGLWGYIDPEGNWLIEPRFAEARQFLDGLAAAREGERWGYIGTDGAWVIEPVYDNFEDYAHPGDPSPFENGLASVTLNGQPIYIDSTGKQVWPSE